MAKNAESWCLMIAIQAQFQIEINIDKEKYLVIKQSDPYSSNSDISIYIQPNNVILFRDSLIKLLENYHG